LRRISQRCKHKFFATRGTVCYFIFPFNILTKLAYFFHWRQFITMDLSLKVFELASRYPQNRNARRFLDVLWYVALISRSWMLSTAVGLALCSAKHRLFCSRITLVSAVLSSRNVRTSNTACRRSSTLKRVVTFCLLTFLLVRSASVSSSGVRYFPSVSVKFLAFLCLDVVKLFVRRDAYTGIRTFFTVAVSGHWTLQFYHIEIISRWYSVIMGSEHLLQTLRLCCNQIIYYSGSCMEWKLTILWHWNVVLFFTLDSIDRSNSVTAKDGGIFTFKFCGWSYKFTWICVFATPAILWRWMNLLPFHIWCICISCHLVAVHESAMW